MLTRRRTVLMRLDTDEALGSSKGRLAFRSLQDDLRISPIPQRAFTEEPTYNIALSQTAIDSEVSSLKE